MPYNTPPGTNTTTTKLLVKKMREVADAIENNEIPILNEIGDEFLQALELLDLTHKVKRANT